MSQNNRSEKLSRTLLVIPRVQPSQIVGQVLARQVLNARQPISEFHCQSMQEMPVRTAPVQTKVWLGFDEERLYVTFRCQEPCMDALTTKHTARIREMCIFPVVSLDDTVEVLVDARGDLEHGTHLVINPLGRFYSSQHRASAFHMQGDSYWQPNDWTVRADRLADEWRVAIAISANDLGVERFDQGQIIGLNLIRHRTPLREIYSLRPGTLAWTTHWTSELVHEPYLFVPAVLGDNPDSTRGLDNRMERIEKFLHSTPGHDHSRPAPALPWLNNTDCRFDVQSLHIKPIQGQLFWLFLPDYGQLPGLEEEFEHLARVRANYRYIGGFRYGAVQFDKPRCMKASVRQIEIFDEAGQNIAPQAQVTAWPEGNDLDCLTDGNNDTVAIITRNSYFPVHGIFDLHFAEPQHISHVIIRHGEPFGGKINGRRVPLKNINSDFSLSLLRDGETALLSQHVIRSNFEAETTHDFDAEPANQLRLEITAQTYSGIDYPPNEAWQWYYEDRNDDSVDFGVSEAIREVFLGTPSEHDLQSRPISLEYLRYLGDSGMCARGVEPMFDKATESLHQLNPEGFLGYKMWEISSDLSTICSIHNWTHTTSEWRYYPQELPEPTIDRDKARHLWRKLFKRWLDRHYGLGLVMDSWRLLDHYVLAWGARRTLVECSPNGQPSAQIQYAFTRGAARQFGRPWGVYLAVCLGTGAVNYFPQQPVHHYGEEIWTRDADAGPSASLYRRMVFHAYFSGATFLDFESVPETHMVPNKDGTRFEVSAHGQAISELLEYHNSFGERGTPYTPICVLLDHDHGYSAPYQDCYAFGRSGEHTWIKTPYNQSDRTINAFFREVFPYPVQRIERDNYLLTNSKHGDMIDVQVANLESECQQTETMTAYPVLVLLGKLDDTPSVRERLGAFFERGGLVIAHGIHRPLLEVLGLSSSSESDCGQGLSRYRCRNGTVVLYEDAFPVLTDGTLARELADLFYSVCAHWAPFEISGDVQRLFARRESGWDVLLMNNRGVFKFHDCPAQIDSAKAAEVTVRFPDPPKQILCWQAGQSRRLDINAQAAIQLTVPPGGLIVMRIEDTA